MKLKLSELEINIETSIIIALIGSATAIGIALLNEHFKRRSVRLACRVNILFRLKEHATGGNFNAEDIAKIHECMWWWQRRKFDRLCKVWWSKTKGSKEWKVGHSEALIYVESIIG
ncbi:MAG: hypothetical protein I8H95_04700 [Rhodocyclales bacterium]|nr:hypothetical protein [Rhodocyclales bacterium]